MEKKKILPKLNLSKQEFSFLEKHIYILALIKLKSKNFKKDEFIKLTIEVSEIKETKEKIKEALANLTKNKVFFDDQSTGYLVPIIFAEYTTKNNIPIINIHINPAANDLFFELVNSYTTIGLEVLFSLKSSYSIKMYELINLNRNKGSWIIELDKLRTLLEIKDSYQNFAHFEKRILSYSQKELLDVYNLDISWEVSGSVRKKITELTFSIKKGVRN